jgi:hypothetical protein
MKKLFCLITTMSVVIGAQEQVGIRRVGTKAGVRTTAEIMATAKNKEAFCDENVTRGGSKKHEEIGLNFLGARVEQVDYAVPASGKLPPDTMGAVGPTQFIVAINNRIRSFDKQTGIADGILDSKTDGFFFDVSNGSRTSDIRIRYDRFSERWFIIMLTIGDEEPEDDASDKRSNIFPSNNRIMFAVSNTKDISYFTEWSFNYFEIGEGFFFDYPTLGIDDQALYISGLLVLSAGGTPVNQQFFVVNKKQLIEENELVFARFEYFIDSADFWGPHAVWVAQGVDNFDENAQVGNFIAVDSFSANHLVLYQVFNPGSESPTLSDPILIEVPQICLSLTVPHRNGEKNLTSNDSRLIMAQIRDGHLWTTHNIGVNNKGKCCTTKQPTRDGSRWYEIDIKLERPTLIQYGTLFDKTKKNGTDARYFWMPSLNISGQGTMALGCSTAGENRFINCAIARRFKNDPKGILQKPILYTNTHATYNPKQASSGPLRWGDYSYTSVDPCDDMTIWTIQEYAVDTDQWGVQVAQLRAPAPAEPISVTPTEIQQGKSSVTLTICGKSHDGSGFFDPGKDFDCRLQVKISDGVEVEKVKYIDPTTIKVKVSTKHTSLGSKKIKIINPDGQKVRAYDLLTVVA